MQIIFIRTVILYIAIIVSLRLLGKRQIGELEPTELVVTLLIAELASVPMQDLGIPLLHGLIPIVVIICLELLSTFGMLKSLRFRKLMCGRPSFLIRDGVIDEAQMRKNRMTTDELLEELRIQRITDITTVKYAILETSGQLSTLLYAQENAATAKQVKASVTEAGFPIVLINDGRLIRSNLEYRGLDLAYVDRKLSAKGIRSINDVFLMMVDELDGVYIQLKNTN
ncbi:DUF421 domain-containing protein [Oscillospiraceae bacterium OttesenSCG-928-G22]|nr:DUF421 domain-containing protein [Oscillospiraceae bacterium OttesenSCG-928-G22]